jgi:hypothetical protein
MDSQTIAGRELLTMATLRLKVKDGEYSDRKDVQTFVVLAKWASPIRMVEITPTGIGFYDLMTATGRIGGDP